MAQRLHLVDGTYELFRAHYSKRPSHAGPDGTPLKATVGLVSSMLSLVHDEQEAVTHLGVAFDNPIESFRNRLFDEYKTGEGMDPELRAQFDIVEAGMRAMGVVVWSMDEWEADDALATAAVRWKSDFDQVRIMTPDKDLGQMLDDRVVQVDRRRKKEIDPSKVVERWGVGPASIPDLLALMGDSADGIPGLSGFGEKSAGKVLAKFEHIEDIPKDEADWDVGVRGAARLAETLREHYDDALLYRKLATLVTDVPLPEDVSAMGFRGVPKDRFTKWCESIAAPRLIERTSRWA